MWSCSRRCVALWQCTQGARWLVLGFFGMLRRSKLAALRLGGVRA